LRLLTGPPGSGKSQAALERIREAATVAGARGRAARTAGQGEALLVLPTYGEAQHALRSALHRWDARGLFDAPFVTFTSAGERFLPGFRVRSLPSAEERDRLLELALAKADVPAFRGSRVHRGFRARLLRLLKDVKQGALAPAQALARLAERAASLPPAPRERLEGFLAVAAAYTAQLDAAGLEDHEDALQRLRTALEAGAPEHTPALLVVDGFDDMTPVEEAILLALVRHGAARGGEVLVTLPFEEARADLFASAAGLRSRLLAAGFVEQRLTGFRRAPGGALEHLAAGFGGPGGGVRDGGGEVEALLALDTDDEDEAVAHEVRRLLDETSGPDARVRGARDVLLVLPDLDARGPGLVRALERLGVPCHLAGPRPLAAQAWVRGCEAPLVVLAGRLAAGERVPERVLDSLRARALLGDPAVDVAVLDRHEMRWRREGFPADWAALRADADPALAPVLDLWEQARVTLAAVGAASAGHVLAALDQVVPLPAPSGLGPDGTPHDRAHDAVVRAALVARERLSALARARIEAAARAGSPLDGRAAADDLLEALPRAAFTTREQRLDAVHLVDPDEARGWEAAVVIVVGLGERSLPRRSQEDPLLADEERERVGEGGVRLPTSAEREARERRRMLALLTRARRRLVLSRPAFSPEGDVLPPAGLWQEVERHVRPRLRARPARVGPGAPALVSCRARAELVRFAAARVARPGENAAGDAAGEARIARALLAALDPGLLARAARWRLTSSDPLPAEALARFAASIQRVSPSRLNAAHACTQRHFLARVVGLPEDDAPLGGPAFGSRELGRVAHAALHLALRKPASPPEAVADEALEAQPVPGVEREALRLEVARIVALFRLREAEIAGAFVPDPAWLEAALGGAQATVRLGRGGGAFLLTGRVDRVDVAPARGTLPRALVVDYKLGATAATEHFKDARREHDLQLPLYARALEVGHGFTVVGLEWASMLSRTRRLLLDEATGSDAAGRAEGVRANLLPEGELRALLRRVERIAADVVERVRSGEHELAPRDEEECVACPVRASCRPDRLAVALAAERRALRAPPEPWADDA
jgi:hypothetical protein